MTTGSIVQELSYLLWGAASNKPRDKTWKILRAILKSMAAALQKGEQVRIRGLGTFTVRTRKPVKKRLTYFYGDMRHDYTEIVQLPAKKYVHFEPNPSILRTLNEQS
jgi:nucleoid DNA-binding protein